MIDGESWRITPGFDVRTFSDDRFVASVFGTGSKQKLERARLIAAAPELYRVLKEIESLRLDLIGSAEQIEKIRAVLDEAERGAS